MVTTTITIIIMVTTGITITGIGIIGPITTAPITMAPAITAPTTIGGLGFILMVAAFPLASISNCR